MKRLIIFFIGLIGIVQAQQLDYTNMIKVSIVEPSELYYNYILSFNEQTQLSFAVTDTAVFNDILDRCTETGWPANLKDFDWRKKNAGFFKSLNVYFVAELSDFLSVLVAPVAYNEKLFKKAKIETTRDIYLLIPKVAIRR